MEIVAPGIAHYQDSTFCLAADIGQAQDPTAIAVIEKVMHSHVRRNGDVIKKWRELKVRHLERIPLGTDYVQQVEYVHQIYQRPPLYGTCDLALDDTGVGKSVGDLFLAFGMKPIRVTITAGDAQMAKPGNRWSVSKGNLVSMLDAVLHSQELKIAPDMPEANTLKEELKNFQRSVSAAGRFTYSARVGRHDDLVLAVAIGVWALIGRKKPQPAIVMQARLT